MYMYDQKIPSCSEGLKLKIPTVIQTLNNGHNAQIPMHVVSEVDCQYLGEVLLGEMSSESEG